MLRFLFWFIVLAVIAAPLAFLALALEPEPVLPQTDALTPAQAAESKALVKRARETANGEGSRVLTASRRELDGLIATGARVAPSLRGRTEIGADGVKVALAVQPPMLDALGWVNLRAEVAPSQDGLDVRSIRLGRMDLPPETTLAVLRWAADAVSDVPIGTLLVDSVRSVETRGGELRLAIAPQPEGEGSLFARVMDGVRQAAGMAGGSAVQAHYDAMAEAAAAGRLNGAGPATPWFRYAVARVAEAGHESAEAAREDMKAAIMALAAHCGDPKPIRQVAGEFETSEPSKCRGTTFAGRKDLRKHFLLSAAFAAAGGSALSFGFGEVKELVDASGGGSGFSFDDVAADRSGIAWAETLLAAEPSELGTLAEMSERESAIMTSIEGLPSFMQQPEFEAKFGGVDTPRYKAQVEEIDARIAALPIHAR